MTEKPNKKTQAIVQAATLVFIQKGYAGTSMDLVAQKANVSKITIYKHFQNKSALFSRMMKDHCEKIFHNAPIIKYFPNKSPKEILTVFCASFVEALLRPESVGLMRRIIGEVDLFPGLTSQIWTGGKMPILEEFVWYLQDEMKANRLSINDPELAARQLFGMIKENLVYPVWFGTQLEPRTHDQLKVIEACIDMFLLAYGGEKASPLPRAYRI